MARNRAQTEPLVRADWVPQTKFLTSKDLLAAGDESRGTHNNKGGGESRETSPKLRLLNECGADWALGHAPGILVSTFGARLSISKQV